MRSQHRGSQRCLLVFTDHFPFGGSETFFAQELPFLADTFDTVIIVPTKARADDGEMRPLPGNTVVRPLPRRRIEDWRWWALKWGPRMSVSPYRLVRQNPLTDPIKFAVDLRFSALVFETYARVRRALADIDFSQFSSVTMYSYWFFTGIGVARMLREKELAQVPTVVVARAHAYDVDEENSPRGYLGSRPFLLESIDRAFPISDRAVEILLAYKPSFGDRIETRRLGVPPAQRHQRHRGAPLWLVSCSHLGAHKRVDMLAEAVGLLQRDGVDVRWTHIGGADAHEVRRLEDCAKARALYPDTIEFRGQMSNDEVRDFYVDNDVSVFVNCSTTEGVPVSIMEAQAAGMVVVATDAGATAEIVHDGENGLVIPVNSSASDLAGAIAQVASMDEESFQAWSEAAVNGWRANSQAEKQYGDFAAELLQLALDTENGEK